MATSAFTKTITAGEAVKNVMSALGLDLPSVVFESQDTNAVQLRFLLTRAGQRLISKNNWQFLMKEHTITTVVSQTQYPLPADFDSYVSDAAWNRTSRLPAIGSLSEQEWQVLVARQGTGPTFTSLYRIRDNQVEFYEAPSSVQTIVMPYTSRGWVLKADASYADNATDDADVVLYDRQLIEAALRLEWDIEKRFDTTAAVQAVNDALGAARSKDKPGRILSLNRASATPLMGVLNLPDSGYGS